MGVSTVPLLSETGIPPALWWGGTFVMSFNANASIAQSEELAAQICHGTEQPLQGSPC